MKSSISRVDALERKLKSKPVWPLCDCLMNDGDEQRFYGMTVIQPFLDGEIAAITTNDADLAAMLRQMDAGKTVEINLI